MRIVQRSSVWPDGTKSSAVFSECDRFRYELNRRFAGHVEGSGHPAFVMLNPSTATHDTNDPTVRRCEGFARSWGYTALRVVNLYAMRATDPKELYAAADPGDDEINDYCIERAARDASVIVCAWGAFKDRDLRARAVLRLLAPHADKLRHLGTTKRGQPRHPLYLRGDSLPQPFTKEQS